MPKIIILYFRACPILDILSVRKPIEELYVIMQTRGMGSKHLQAAPLCKVHYLLFLLR